MKIKLVQLNSKNDLDADDVIFEKVVPENGGAITITDDDGREIVIERGPSGGFIISSARSEDTVPVVVPSNDETALFIKMMKDIDL